MATPKKKKPANKSGGALSGMRSGMQRMAGKGHPSKKAAPPSFTRVFLWGLGIAVLLFLVWSFSR